MSKRNNSQKLKDKKAENVEVRSTVCIWHNDLKLKKREKNVCTE